MKIKTLTLLAGISAPLILGGSTFGGFLGLNTSFKPNGFGITTLNVYAVFDRPGEDHMLAVAGTFDNPLTIEVIGGTFYQHVAGTDEAPNPLLFAAFPSLRYDSFVTIGVKSFNPGDPGNPEGQPADNLILTPGWPGFGASVMSFDDGGWAVTSLEAQGDPFDPVNCFPGDGRVLIGQFSTADGLAIHGTMLLQVISNGVAELTVVSFFNDKTCTDDRECTDGDPCNGEELCVAGQCLAFPPSPDCNSNGVLDSCDIGSGTSPDCNGNGVPDECDIASGTSQDFNNDGIPDVCQCISDIDGDGTVGIGDFLKLLADWGACSP